MLQICYNSSIDILCYKRVTYIDTHSGGIQAMRTYAAGQDFGNSLTKSIVYVAEDKFRTMTIPSAIADADFTNMVRLRRGINYNGSTLKSILLDGEYAVEYDGKQYYVGQLAIRERNGVDPTSLGNAARYWSTQSLMSLLTTTGVMIKDTEYSILVVTGLPVFAHDEETVSQVKKQLNGSHQFMLNGQSRTAHIKVGKVLMEAAGAVIHGGIENNSNTYGVIDIGSYTTDFYVMEGLVPVTKKCGSREIGVHNATSDVAAKFEQKYKFPLRHDQRERILSCYKSGNYTDMSLSEPRMYADLANWTRDAVDTVSSNIVNEARAIWRTGSQGLVAANFSRVEVVGGGARYFFDAISRVIPPAKTHRSPELSNVKGYASFANTLLQARSIA